MGKNKSKGRSRKVTSTLTPKESENLDYLIKQPQYRNTSHAVGDAISYRAQALREELENQGMQKESTLVEKVHCNHKKGDVFITKTNPLKVSCEYLSDTACSGPINGHTCIYKTGFQ